MKQKMEVTEYTHCSPLSRKYTFAFLSDLHESENEPIFALLEKLAPDAVLIAGDFIHSEACWENGMTFLTWCAERYPTICSLGREVYFSREFSDKIRKTGAMLLDNSGMMFGEIWIGGFSSVKLKGKPKHIRKKLIAQSQKWLQTDCPDTGLKILLCHHPEYYPMFLRQYPIDLILAGHAHGGQWRFFNRGIFAPGQGLFPKYTAGIHENRLIVNRGIGNVYPIPRINNKPEMIVLYLKHN